MNNEIDERHLELMMGALGKDLSVWETLSWRDKVLAVEEVMATFRERDNTGILKSAPFYIRKLDEAFAANPKTGRASLEGMIRVLATVEYDFYNGQDADRLARGLLDSHSFKANKARLEWNSV